MKCSSEWSSFDRLQDNYLENQLLSCIRI